MVRDITVCINDKCPSKKDCDRYMPEESMSRGQTYATFTPANNGTCKFYLTMEK